MSTGAGEAARDGEAAVSEVTGLLDSLDSKLNGEAPDEEEDGDETTQGM